MQLFPYFGLFASQNGLLFAETTTHMVVTTTNF